MGPLVALGSKHLGPSARGSSRWALMPVGRTSRLAAAASTARRATAAAPEPTDGCGRTPFEWASREPTESIRVPQCAASRARPRRIGHDGARHAFERREPWRIKIGINGLARRQCVLCVRSCAIPSRAGERRSHRSCRAKRQGVTRRRPAAFLHGAPPHDRIGHSTFAWQVTVRCMPGGTLYGHSGLRPRPSVAVGRTAAR